MESARCTGSEGPAVCIPYVQMRMCAFFTLWGVAFHTPESRASTALGQQAGQAFLSAILRASHARVRWPWHG